MSEEQSQSEPQATAPPAPQGAEDDEIAVLKAKMEEMEQEAAKLRELQQQITGNDEGKPEEDDESRLDAAQREDIDSRSVFVGSVDYASTPEELHKHFQSVGNINRITILTDKFTGNPKGFAYIEFSDASMVQKAIDELNGSTFRGRELKVTAKRTNLPGFGGRGRGGRGGARGRGGGRGRGRGRGGFRARGRGGFKPY